MRGGLHWSRGRMSEVTPLPEVKEVSRTDHNPHSLPLSLLGEEIEILGEKLSLGRREG